MGFSGNKYNLGDKILAKVNDKSIRGYIAKVKQITDLSGNKRFEYQLNNKKWIKEEDIVKVLESAFTIIDKDGVVKDPKKLEMLTARQMNRK